MSNREVPMPTEAPGATLPPDEYLSTEEISHLHELLQKQMTSLVEQSKDAIQQFTDMRAQDADALDLAVSESNRDFSLRLADRERRLMRKIRHSLSRMHDGEFGVCESCGNAISYARLLARPVATQCIDCKTQAEQLERGRRVF
jgi:DnaK suppressor protein